jgi:hypothetical protein
MLNDKLILVGVAGLAAVATAGWMRPPQSVLPATTVSNFQPVQPEQLPDPLQQPVNPSALYVAGPVDRFNAPAPATTVSTRARRSEPAPVQTAAVRRAPVAYDDRPVIVEQNRSKKASAAIIGGSAAAGAAIGGLAGGGKGAIIGAVAGGAAGAVYDRATYKKKNPSGEVTDAAYERREGRSTLERAAIIGGGAAAGAAIGGAAGGGKGAAIGALGGGAAGYIYDRVTRNK